MPRSALASLLIASFTASSESPSLLDLLDRAGEYVAAYEHEASGVVLEESYNQSAGSGNHVQTRVLLSDLVLVSVPGEPGLLGFRDVFIVDGKPVRDHDQRLQKLFLQPTAEGLAHALEVLGESARYNLGHTRRNYNLPTMPLLILRSESRGRFAFSLLGPGKANGRRAWLVGFEEEQTPTLIRNPDEDHDYFLRGSFTIDEKSGAVLRSEMRLNLRPGRSELIVDYEWVKSLSLWLPARMRESHDSGQKGWARYRKPRRFGVTTEERVAPPK